MPTLRLLTSESGTASHGGEVSACAFSPDNQFILSGGWDGHLRLWDAQGAHVSALKVSERPVSACAVSPDGKQWLSGTLEGMLSHWDPATGEQISTFLAHTRPISAIVFSADGRSLATASWDRALILWNLARERDGRTLAGHGDIVAGCRFTPDGKALLSWSHDCSLRLWECARARALNTFAGHSDRLVSGSVSADGRWAASGARDRVLKLWDLQTEREAASLTLTAPISFCSFLLDAESLLTAENNGRVSLYSVPELQPRAELLTRLSISCGALAPCSGQVALGCDDGRVHLVAIDGFDGAPLVVTVTQTSRRTATKLERFFGKSRLIHSYLCTCPACRQSFELPGSDPAQQALCPNCRRQLRVSAVTPMLQEK